MIKLGNKEVENRYITDDNGVPHEVVAAYVGNNLVYNAKVDEANAEFYKRKTGGTQSVGSGIAAIKEVRGKSIVWNQLVDLSNWMVASKWTAFGGTVSSSNQIITYTAGSTISTSSRACIYALSSIIPIGHRCFMSIVITSSKGTKVQFRTNNAGGDSDVSIGANERTILNFVSIGILSGTDMFLYVNRDGTLAEGDTIELELFQLIDLTLMFGAGNEPATVADFEKMFTLDYYNYNAGEVIPFAGQNLVTTGKNQYNPATGKANLLGGQTYQLLGTYTSATIDGVAVTLDSNNSFTTTKDCVLDITGGNDTDTMVAIYNGENSAYEPYEKHTLPLDPSQWRDKQGNLVFPYGGMHGVGSAYDYAKVDADGYIRKAVRVMAVENILDVINFLSSCNGGDTGTTGWGGTNTIAFYSSSYAISSNIIRSNATHKLVGFSKAQDGAYNVYTQYIEGFNSDYYNIRIPRADLVLYGYDNSSVSSNKAAFKAYLQDKKLLMVYQLATPVEVELATPVYAKYLVNKDGTEEITPANGTKPYTTMANLHLVYPKK